MSRALLTPRSGALFNERGQSGLDYRCRGVRIAGQRVERVSDLWAAETAEPPQMEREPLRPVLGDPSEQQLLDLTVSTARRPRPRTGRYARCSTRPWGVPAALPRPSAATDPGTRLRILRY